MSRTSITMPQYLWKSLEKASVQCGVSKQSLAVLCLYSFKGSMKAAKLSRRSTVRYQAEPSQKKLYLVLSDKGHNYVQGIRNLKKISVSLLFTKAISRCLKKILEQLKNNSHPLQPILAAHRVIEFQHLGILAYRLILLHPPPIVWHKSLD